MREIEFELYPESRAPHRAREVLRDFVGGHSSDRFWAAELLLSELVTNVVQHAHTSMTIRIRLTGESFLHVEVADHCKTPVVWGAVVEPEVPRGRGLALMEQLSDRAMVDEEPTGKCVGFDITL